MIRIEFANLTNEKFVGLSKKYNAIARLAAKKVNLKGKYTVSVSLVDDEMIHNINREYRNIDRVTDVISFAFLDNDDLVGVKGVEKLLGDIYIAKDVAVRQASEYNHSLERELCFLFLHGLLHLLGYDHVNSKEEEKVMFDLQDEILGELNINREVKEC